MNSHTTAAKTYSPFWALCLLFGTLIFLQVAYVIDDFKQRSQIQAAREQLKPILTKAQNISQTTEAVGRELVALSPTSPEAAKIISELKIQVNKPVETKK
jgi:archaellum component FlaC